MKTVAQITGGAQSLLPISLDIQSIFEEYLSVEYKAFLHLLRVVESYIVCTEKPDGGKGRPPYKTYCFIRGELAKRHFHIEKTDDLITRLRSDPNLRLLCGFKKVPHKSTFSRAFAYLSSTQVFDLALEALVKDAHKDLIVYHVCRDSTAIPAREKPRKKTIEKPNKIPKKRGRPAKNTPKPVKEPTVLENQVHQTPVRSLAGISKECAWGCKKNSEGHIQTWKGYKLHLDVSDTGFPLTACLSGANVHDSQLAIPMEQLTEQKVTFLYSLMDSAYDARAIDRFIRERGRVPIIDTNTRRDSARPPLDPAKKERYKIRTTVERSNSDLKDNYIPRAIYVKGYAKISFVLMAALLCLAATKYLQYFIL